MRSLRFYTEMKKFKEELQVTGRHANFKILILSLMDTKLSNV